jgi:cytochrome P450
MAYDLAQELMREITARGAWFLLLLPLFLLLARYSLLSRSKEKQGGKQRQQEQDHHRLPPSPPALPILGHLHLVGSVPHVSFRSLARKHGYDDLMLLRLGAMPVLVVSSPRAAEAVLRTHDHVFASRPHSVVAEVVLYGPSDIGFAPYGEYWRQTKKLVTTHLLSVRRVQAFRLAREEGVRTVMGKITGAAIAGASLDVSELLGSFANDLACRAVMGKSFRSEARNKLLRQLVGETSQLLGGFNVEEFFPFLARFGVVSKAVRTKSERLRERWDELLDRLIQDHENGSHPHANKDGGDFIHVLLSFQHEYGLEKEHVKALLVVSTISSQLDRGICIANYIEEQPFAGI